ncbi:daunorubicin resistance protein DrrA family ABC transporter ATP-binding protein [Actinomadura flavalba]|uniref:daunorubicin resistance protein DrrA family ABC transporter ATP-binding protein n=1 Tax=Actinomadura flavalba TaxID=1120938 RepID=UPI0003654A75|nr:daunorubicin resistance protein DrrA family ABC transporter ATP-binding protein [Actinomadura flavalba]
MTHTPAIETAALGKSFGAVRVLGDITLTVPAGGVFALLGPNGSGKTTLVRVLSTLTRPDAGTARVLGHDVVSERRALRARISLTGQYAALDELQTGTENLAMMGRLRGLGRTAARRRADELLERFDLTGAARRRVLTYSGGMRRRLDIAASLVTPPDLLFLDEPTTGLDPRSRHTMWDMVTDLTRAGVTVFLTTQYLEEADRLADRIALLDGGRVAAEGTADQLKARVSTGRLDLVLDGPAAFADALRALGDRAVHIDSEHATLGVTTTGGAAEIRALLDELDPDRTAVRAFTVRPTTLDDVFFALTGRAQEATRV